MKRNLSFGGNQTSMFIWLLTITETDCVGNWSAICASEFDALLWRTITILKQTKQHASFSASIHRLTKKIDKFCDWINFCKHRIKEIADFIRALVRHAWLAASTFTSPAGWHCMFLKLLDCFSENIGQRRGRNSPGDPCCPPLGL